MKRKKSLSIKWKIFIFLIGFTVFLLALVWYFQIVHLESFYKYIKKHELKDAAKLLEDSIGSDNMDAYFDELADEYDIGVNLVDEEGKSLYSANISEMSHIYIWNPEQFTYMKEQAEANGGVAMYEVDGRYRQEFLENVIGNSNNEFSGLQPGEGDYFGNPNKPDSDKNSGGHFKEPGSMQELREPVTEARSVVYIKLLNTENGMCYLLVSSLITPVDATVYTLRIQFVYITVIFLVLSIVIALLISQVVSKPIVKINDSAKHLAEGKFDIHFAGTGYREVQELSHTLNYAADELGKAELLQRDLVANISHDLRTPLTMITAYAEVMRDIPGENNPENVQIIIDEATRLTTLVNDLLVLSKLQSGVSELNKVCFDFTSNIQAVMNRFSKLTEQDGYSIRFEYRDNVKVYADEYKIYQVVYNLLNNAINYAGEDKEVIMRQIVHGDILRFEVEDHGAGIAENELDNIWDRYYKIDKNHKRAVQGTGLGLSIVQNILKLHDSKFGVRSSLGKGSVFWFELVVSNGDEEEE